MLDKEKKEILKEAKLNLAKKLRRGIGQIECSMNQVSEMVVFEVIDLMEKENAGEKLSGNHSQVSFGGNQSVMRRDKKMRKSDIPESTDERKTQHRSSPPDTNTQREQGK